MKKILKLLLLLIVIMPTIAFARSYETYENAEIDLKMTFMDNWEIESQEKTKTFGEEFYLIAQDEKTLLTLQVNENESNIENFKYMLTPTLNSYATSFLESFQETLDYKTKYFQIKENDNKTLKFITFDIWDREKNRIDKVVYYTVVNGKDYVFIFGNNPENETFESIEVAFMMSTVEIEDNCSPIKRFFSSSASTFVFTFIIIAIIIIIILSLSKKKKKKN